jgi:hypothetical protein
MNYKRGTLTRSNQTPHRECEAGELTNKIHPIPPTPPRRKLVKIETLYLSLSLLYYNYPSTDHYPRPTENEECIPLSFGENRHRSDCRRSSLIYVYSNTESLFHSDNTLVAAAAASADLAQSYYNGHPTNAG